MSTTNCKVYPVAFGNDGTALKPSIQFDERAKVNVGLAEEIDLKYVKDNMYMKKGEIQQNIVTEAIVSSITTLDNICSLPVAIKYSPKQGKTGNDVKELFTEQIRILQICENCQKRSEHILLTIPRASIDLCESACNECLQIEEVFDQCKIKGFISHIPSVRPCEYCMEHDMVCVKRVVMILTSDCEEGNKQCMEKLKQEIDGNTVDPHLSLLSIVPDCPHVLKTCKASFSNWYLQLLNERGCLSLFYTLRNKAEPEVRKKIKTFLPRNDYVRNRDRQDPTSVLKLCDGNLADYITQLGFIVHTIIPETVRFTTTNRVNTYSNILSISIGPFGYFFFLQYNTLKNVSDIYKVKLHNPVQDITLISSNVQGSQIHYYGGLLYCTDNSSPITINVIDNKSNPTVTIDKIRSKKDIIAVMELVNIESTGALKVCKSRLSSYQEKTKKLYSNNKWNLHQINFRECTEVKLYDAIIVLDSKTVFGACAPERRIEKIEVARDSVGLQGKIESDIPYQNDWEKVYSLAIVKDCVVVLHGNGASMINLENHCITEIINDPSKYLPRFCCSYKDGILFTSKGRHRVDFWNPYGIKIFAGSDDEGSRYEKEYFLSLFTYYSTHI